MELDDLLVALGLSSSESDLQRNGIGNFETIQGREFVLNQEWTVSAYLIRNSEFRINSKHHGSRRGEI